MKKKEKLIILILLFIFIEKKNLGKNLSYIKKADYIHTFRNKSNCVIGILYGFKEPNNLYKSAFILDKYNKDTLYWILPKKWYRKEFGKKIEDIFISEKIYYFNFKNLSNFNFECDVYDYKFRQITIDCGEVRWYDDIGVFSYGLWDGKEWL